MAISHLYRINGGEVLGATVDDPLTVWQGLLSGDNATYYTSVTDADTSGYTDGQRAIYSGGVIRDATAPEIVNFPVAQAEDENLLARLIAKDVMDASVIERKKWKALAAILIDEINTLRALHSLPDRTLAQAKTAFINKIEGGGEID